MKLNTLAIKLTLAFSTLAFIFLPTTVYAAGEGETTPITACTFIAPICRALGLIDENGTITPDGAREFLSERLQLILSLVFVGIILLSVVIIVQSGVKYIQSQGDAGKIEEATKAIKTVFVGIAILFVGIAGLVLVLFVFNATGLLTPSAPTGPDGSCTIDPITLVFTCPNSTDTNPN